MRTISGPQLLDDAWRHGVDFCVLGNLARLLEGGTGPAERLGGLAEMRVAALLARAREASLHAFLLWEQRTRRVAEVLGSAGISPGIVLKGGALRYQVYPSPWLRAAADLDLLLPAEQVRGAVGALVDRGWTLHLPVAERAWSMRHGHHVTVWQDGFHVELHRAVDQNHRPTLSYAALANGALPAAELGERLLFPPLRQQLLVAAAHALKHALNIPLKSLVDVHLLVENGATDDVGETLAAARCEKLDGALGLMLSACVELFGTRLPGGLLAGLSTGRVRRDASRFLLSAWREGFFPEWLGRDTLQRRLAAHLLLVTDLRFVGRVGGRFLLRRVLDVIDRIQRT